MAFVHHIKDTDLYVVISKNKKDITESINRKKMILERKLNDELSELLKGASGIGNIDNILSNFFKIYKYIN